MAAIQEIKVERWEMARKIIDKKLPPCFLCKIVLAIGRGIFFLPELSKAIHSMQVNKNFYGFATKIRRYLVSGKAENELIMNPPFLECLNSLGKQIK